MKPLSDSIRRLMTKPSRRDRRARRNWAIEQLEVRDVPAVIAFDFGTATTPAAEDYVEVPLVAYSASLGYGWQSVAGMSAVDRGTADPMTRDLHLGTNATFLANVPNGQYDVVATLGDATTARDNVSVTAEGQGLVTSLGTTAGQFLEARGRINVTDGQVSVAVADGGGSNNQFALAGLTFTPVNPTAPSLWAGTTPVAQTATNDPNAVELGVRFQPAVNGTITGLRYYKAATNTGTHVGHLWTSTGTLLATATFANETASGWQQVNFATPVAVTAGTTYVASYYAPNGNYTHTADYFRASGFSAGNLTALSAGTTGNGVYRYGVGGGFPSSTFDATNYWVDVVFQAGGTSAAVTANAGADKSGKEGRGITFSGSATGTGLTYSWNFGDGGTATGTLTPSYKYRDNGTYTATLTVTNSAGQSATDTAVVTVTNVAPTASGVGDTNPVNEGSPVTVYFTGVTDPSVRDTAAGFRYSYDFNNDGTWDVVNSTSSSAVTTYADNGAFYVRMRVMDKDGGSTTYVNRVDVSNAAPTATFAPTGTVPAGSPAAFNFTNQADPSSVDAAAGFRYSFDFDNNGTWDVTDSTQATAQYSYGTAGTYTVRGRIKDKDGAATTYTTTVTVSQPTGGTPPTANAGPDQSANEGAAVAFTGSATGTGLSYAWNFGDGKTATGTLTPSHAYADNGTYTVTLTVTNSAGQSATDTAVVTVANVAPSGTLGSNGPRPEGSAVTLSFTGVSDPSSADTTAGLRYSFDFNNDGSYEVVDSTSATAQTTFADNGTYTIGGRIRDKDGGFVLSSTTVTVTNVAPTATFTGPGSATAGTAASFTFTNATDVSGTDLAAGLKYSFDFDNNGTFEVTNATSASAQYTYTAAGTYTARGRVSDKDGGFTDYTAAVTVTGGTPTGGYSGIIRTFYVATTGNDSNSGSSASPWRTLQKAADVSQPGDMIVVRAGTYVGFQTTRSGTAANPIVFKADPGVLVNAKHASVSAYAGAINLEGASYVAIDGFTVTMASTGSVRSNIRSVENTGVIIRNNTIDDASWWGILTGNSANVLIEYNTVTDTINEHGIYVGNSADNPVVRNNRVENSRSAGIQINADRDLPGDGIISNPLVENNVLLNNARMQGSSLNLNGVEDGIVRNNLIASQYRNGIAIYQDNQTDGVKRMKIIGNTIVGPAWYSISASGAGTVDNQIRNNILISQGWGSSYRGGLGVENITGLQSNHNILMGRVNRDPSNTESPSESAAQWRARGFDTNSIFLEEVYSQPSTALSALFVGSPGWPLYSAASGDYRLKAGSPAVNAGTNLPQLTTDLLGFPRPSGSSTDIGAYEYGASGDTTPPTAAVTAPTSGATATGTVQLSANATDNVGVVGVQFFVDGTPVGDEDTTSPYSINWDSSSVGNGAHTVTARARDAAGNTTTSAAVNITTSNALSGPVLAFSFNQGSGTTVTSTGSAGLTGTITGATWTTAGQYGSALSFNGTNASVRVADNAAIDFTTGMTISAWVRPTTGSGFRTIALKETSSTSTAYGLYAATDAGGPGAYVNTGGGDLGATSASALPLNAWSYVSMTYGGGSVRLYVNGQLVATQSATGTLINSSGALAIGGNTQWGEWFGGLIDEVRVYNRALTAAEITTDMNTPI